ncbi:hypothetical protein LTR70_004315 [Exophiala xenobiotica]|uniref:Uncharacterized protein n=1 Tax=Lithohypha guttulata TaxID=1690604 RepID=A0ABR0KDX9_9EURO|nr:hypothetical protein LTR24_003720 [Lithohypha guttulata]KAK5321070.1 hypothetical protein LTR70_004315 [Exophiala xenobiotica]
MGKATRVIVYACMETDDCDNLTTWNTSYLADESSRKFRDDKSKVHELKGSKAQQTETQVQPNKNHALSQS